MDLTFNYIKIRKIAKEVKKSYKVNSLVEIVQYVFSDEDVLSAFIREGLDLKTNAEADNKISEAMENGADYFEIQQDVIRALIAANFYKKELQTMIDSLTTQTEVQN